LTADAELAHSADTFFAARSIDSIRVGRNSLAMVVVLPRRISRKRTVIDEIDRVSDG
jgi:hypothetical protein